MSSGFLQNVLSETSVALPIFWTPVRRIRMYCFGHAASVAFLTRSCGNSFGRPCEVETLLALTVRTLMDARRATQTTLWPHWLRAWRESSIRSSLVVCCRNVLGVMESSVGDCCQREACRPWTQPKEVEAALRRELVLASLEAIVPLLPEMPPCTIGRFSMKRTRGCSRVVLSRGNSKCSSVGWCASGTLFATTQAAGVIAGMQRLVLMT